MSSEWNPVLKTLPAAAPLMWVVDTATQTIVDMTPSIANFLDLHQVTADMRTLSREYHEEVGRTVAGTGQAHTVFEWMNYSGAWHKLARTTTHLVGTLVLNQTMEVTEFDPRAVWLARINLETQRMQMEDGESMSFDEFAVLHLILKGLVHKRIAKILNISAKTVGYRISRLKIAIGAETTEEMMQKVSSSGLIHLGLLPVDLENPARTELELYRRVIG